MSSALASARPKSLYRRNPLDEGNGRLAADAASRRAASSSSCRPIARRRASRFSSASCRAAACCAAACRAASCCAASCRAASCRAAAFCSDSCRATSCCAAACRSASCRAVSCRVASCRAAACRSASCRATSFCAAACRSASCRATSFCAAACRSASCRAASICSACRRASCRARSSPTCSTARSRASSSICARASLAVSRSGGIAVSELDALGAVGMTGVGTAGVTGTTHVGSSDRAEAITADSGTGGGAVPPGRTARKGVFAGAAPLAAPDPGFTPSLEWVPATIAAVVRLGVSAGDTGGVSANPPATGCSARPCCNGSASGVTAVSGALTCTGTSTTRRSGASIRRSCQGKRKAKPVSPRPCPPKVRLNSSAWISRENSSASFSRVRSRVMRWLGRWPRPAAIGERVGIGSKAFTSP